MEQLSWFAGGLILTKSSQVLTGSPASKPPNKALTSLWPTWPIESPP